MPSSKFPFIPVMATVLLVTSATPAFAVQYSPGVAVGQYVKYGNFVGSGPGYESFANYSFLTLQVVGVSGSDVELLSSGLFKNGTALPGNGTVSTWDVQAGTEDGTPSTQGPIIAGSLRQGDAIPPPNTYTINLTETRVYLGVSRSVNVLNAAVSTPDYNTTISYVYDQMSGMLLETSSQTLTQAQPQPVVSTYSYGVIETNIFGSSASPTPVPTPTPTIPEFPGQITVLTLLAVSLTTAFALVLRGGRSGRIF